MQWSFSYIYHYNCRNNFEVLLFCHDAIRPKVIYNAFPCY